MPPSQLAARPGQPAAARLEAGRKVVSRITDSHTPLMARREFVRADSILLYTILWLKSSRFNSELRIGRSGGADEEAEGKCEKYEVRGAFVFLPSLTGRGWGRVRAGWPVHIQ